MTSAESAHLTGVSGRALSPGPAALAHRRARPRRPSLLLLRVRVPPRSPIDVRRGRLAETLALRAAPDGGAHALAALAFEPSAALPRP